MRVTIWKRIPSNRFIDGSVLHTLLSKSDEYGTVGAKISALMLYIAIGLCAEEEEDEEARVLRASPTYDELQHLTGLSRPLISAALGVLDRLKLIEREQQGRSVTYQLTGYDYGKGWCKIPSRSISKTVDGRAQIEPFLHFHKRASLELYALKMFLYLLAIRNNETSVSSASYETLCDRTKIPRRHINKTVSLLLSTGLLSNIKQGFYQEGNSEQENGANKYYVSGFNDLLIRR